LPKITGNDWDNKTTSYPTDREVLQAYLIESFFVGIIIPF
jgi:hypothetical protein